MPLFRLTNIIKVATNPDNLADARVHVGGWSESFWASTNQRFIDRNWEEQQRTRAIMLPPTAAIVGFRQQSYSIRGNKLYPGGTTSGRTNVPGRQALKTDLPQVSLQCNAYADGFPNNSRINLRGMPDLIMQGGEYQPSPVFKTALTNFFTAQKAAGFGFVGRDLSQPSARVISYDPGGKLLTLDAVPAGLAEGDFIRLHRCYSDNGDPISGAFLVNGVPGLRTVPIANFNFTLTRPSGTARKDLLRFMQYGDMEAIRAVVRKIGRPSEQYRGRRSKRTV